MLHHGWYHKSHQYDNTHCLLSEGRRLEMKLYQF